VVLAEVAAPRGHSLTAVRHIYRTS
jgi:hypothetical protein